MHILLLEYILAEYFDIHGNIFFGGCIISNPFHVQSQSVILRFQCLVLGMSFMFMFKSTSWARQPFAEKCQQGAQTAKRAHIWESCASAMNSTASYGMTRLETKTSWNLRCENAVWKCHVKMVCLLAKIGIWYNLNKKNEIAAAAWKYGSNHQQN